MRAFERIALLLIRAAEKGQSRKEVEEMASGLFLDVKEKNIRTLADWEVEKYRLNLWHMIAKASENHPSFHVQDALSGALDGLRASQLSKKDKYRRSSQVDAD
ncbi:hypothetical protein [Paracraurococcus lichenis]|uniref:Uncharacterized protein n=1 Tax=Paracraurococcus lichenis TaxID=3064888 RepID=A0ABT9E2P5_9PROT|nr:hypothetical protein [Paracraurococcus sp. LOR1-02]MDO9710441.1 hypothetical protein [Paracraurococcus sp. LOR1-02]